MAKDLADGVVILVWWYLTDKYFKLCKVKTTTLVIFICNYKQSISCIVFVGLFRKFRSWYYVFNLMCTTVDNMFQDLYV